MNFNRAYSVYSLPLPKSATGDIPYIYIHTYTICIYIYIIIRIRVYIYIGYTRHPSHHFQRSSHPAFPSILQAPHAAGAITPVKPAWQVQPCTTSAPARDEAPDLLGSTQQKLTPRNHMGKC